MASKKKAREPGKAEDVAMTDLITMPEAATLRGVTSAAISELVRRGRLRVVEMFGRRLVSRSEVESFEPERKGWPKGKARKAASTKQPAKRRGRKTT
jgi:hypothetical protein